MTPCFNRVRRMGNVIFGWLPPDGSGTVFGVYREGYGWFYMDVDSKPYTLKVTSVTAPTKKRNP